MCVAFCILTVFTFCPGVGVAGSGSHLVGLTSFIQSIDVLLAALCHDIRYALYMEMMGKIWRAWYHFGVVMSTMPASHYFGCIVLCQGGGGSAP